MWTETIRTLDDIDEMAFPRIAAAAEVGLVARALRQRPAHVGVVPRPGRGARSAVVEPRHPVPPAPPRSPGPTRVSDRASTRCGSWMPGAVVEDAWVRFDEGRVAATGIGEGWRRFAEPHDAIVDGSEAAGAGAILTPGFIDIHGHGGAGESYDDGPEAIRTARALHRAHGTTRAVISLVTAPLDTLERRAAMVADLAATDADVLGSHLEGPFLDPGHKGAHDATLLRAPEPAAVERLLEAGRGTVRQVTLAPELPGALDAIRLVVAAGAAAAVGHTGADAAPRPSGLRRRRDDPHARVQRDARPAPPRPRARSPRRHPTRA